MQSAPNDLKSLVDTFQQELGRLLSPFEIEDLEKSLKEDGTSADLIKEALREAVLNGNQIGNISKLSFETGVTKGLGV